MQYSDTRRVYGFDTPEPHQVVPQDVIKFVQDVQDAVSVIPKGTPTSHRLASSSPYQSVKFGGFVVWYFHHISPRCPNPLFYFTSAGAAGMDPAVWDYIFDKYNRPAEAPTRPLAPDLVEFTSKAHNRKRDVSATRTLIAQQPKRVKADAMSTAPCDSHIDHDVVQDPNRKRGATITGTPTV